MRGQYRTSGRGGLTDGLLKAEGQGPASIFFSQQPFFFSFDFCSRLSLRVFIHSLIMVDKTVSILSTIHGFVSDDAQCETLREHLRAVCLVRDVAFTMHEIAMRATSTAVPAGM